MKKRTRVSLLTLITLILTLVLPTASSGAIPAHHDDPGSFTGSATPLYDDSPLVITEENLTFNITGFESNVYNGETKTVDFSKYDSSLTAQYIIHNPTSEKVTAKYAIPIGVTPTYLPQDLTIADFAKGSDAVKLYLNGVPASFEYRFTSYDTNIGAELDHAAEVSKITDGYQSLVGVTPDTKVTKMIFRIESEYNSADLKFDKDLEGVYAFGRHEDFSNYGNLSSGVFKEIYLLGNIPEPHTMWNIVDSDGQAMKLSKENVSVIESREMTFKELALMNRPKDSAISELDWYNAVIRKIARYGGFETTNDISCLNLYTPSLLCWVVFDLEAEALGEISCSLRTPVLPSQNLYFTPEIYIFHHCFSGEYGNDRRVTVNINTPYYVIGNNFNCQKTAGGYEITFENGAHGTLFFELCESDSPVEDSYGAWEYLPYIIIGFALICVIAGVIAVIIIISGIASALSTIVFACLAILAFWVVLIILITRIIRAKRR